MAVEAVKSRPTKVGLEWPRDWSISFCGQLNSFLVESFPFSPWNVPSAHVFQCLSWYLGSWILVCMSSDFLLEWNWFLCKELVSLPLCHGVSCIFLLIAHAPKYSPTLMKFISLNLLLQYWLLILVSLRRIVDSKSMIKHHQQSHIVTHWKYLCHKIYLLDSTSPIHLNFVLSSSINLPTKIKSIRPWDLIPLVRIWYP